MTVSNCVLAKVQLHLIETILRELQIVSQPKLHCISSKLFWDNFKTSPSRSSFASLRSHSKTVPHCPFAEIPMHLIEVILRQIQIVF